MEQQKLLLLAEERFKEYLDRLGTLGARLEDLVFRAQRMANALKNRQKSRDILFSEDLQLTRRTLRTLNQDVSSLPGLMDWLEREAHYEEDQLTLGTHARSLLSAATGYQKTLSNLCDQARMLHQYTPVAEEKVEVWYMVQEFETMSQKAQTFPFTISTRVINKITTPPPDPGPA